MESYLSPILIDNGLILEFFGGENFNLGFWVNPQNSISRAGDELSACQTSFAVLNLQLSLGLNFRYRGYKDCQLASVIGSHRYAYAISLYVVPSSEATVQLMLRDLVFFKMPPDHDIAVFR